MRSAKVVFFAAAAFFFIYNFSGYFSGMIKGQVKPAPSQKQVIKKLEAAGWSVKTDSTGVLACAKGAREIRLNLINMVGTCFSEKASAMASLTPNDQFWFMTKLTTVQYVVDFDFEECEEYVKLDERNNAAIKQEALGEWERTVKEITVLIYP